MCIRDSVKTIAAAKAFIDDARVDRGALKARWRRSHARKPPQQALAARCSLTLERAQAAAKRSLLAHPRGFERAPHDSQGLNKEDHVATRAEWFKAFGLSLKRPKTWPVERAAAAGVT